jgi:hypothetical protein
LAEVVLVGLEVPLLEVTEVILLLMLLPQRVVAVVDEAVEQLEVETE